MIKLIHMSTAFISISLFLLRGFWVFKESGMMQKKWVRIVPHTNDTILLICGVLLTLRIHEYPFVQGWLTAKLIALLAYIVFGLFALKRAKTKSHKKLYFVLAVLTFGYIVMVALTRSATWFM